MTDADAALDRALDVYRRLQVHHARLVGEQSAAQGVNSTDMRFLFYLAAHAPHGILPKDVTQYLGMSTGATTSLVDRLETRDLVHRVPNPDDRRSVFVTISPTGAGMVREVKDVFREAFREALPDGRVEEFTAMIEAIDAALVTRSND